MLSSAFDQVTKKVEFIEKSVKDSQDMIEIKESNIKKHENEIEKLEGINLYINTKVKTLEEQARRRTMSMKKVKGMIQMLTMERMLLNFKKKMLT